MKTNTSISEIPVTISGFTIGSCVIIITDDLRGLLLILSIPSAANVPITVDISEESTARISVFISAVLAVSSKNSSLYHLSENPLKTARLCPSLNEKNIMITIGA
jgi:hypothetical protein